MVVTQGVVQQIGQPVMFPDRGYSFCNCKNIWFTEWKNIDLENRHSNESVEVLHFYLSDLGLIRNNATEFHTVFVSILNKGYEKNKVLVEGVAPKTIEEFQRLGFVIKYVFGPWDIIWAYHTMEHLQYPLESLKEYYEMLNPGGVLFIAMPDPFFINFDNTSAWNHWLLREHHIMWDMDSFCDEAEAIGFKVSLKMRNMKIKVCKDMHIILRK